MDKLQTLLAVCGGISVIGGAAIMVYRFITPALRPVSYTHLTLPTIA